MKSGWKILFFGLMLITVSSCISYKKNLVFKGEDSLFEDALIQTPTPEYRLRTNDVVYVEVARLYMGDEAYTMGDHLNSQVRAQILNPYIIGNPVGGDGFLDVPMVGRVEALDKTIDELNQEVSARASELYASSSVKLFLLTQNVTVIGEVPRSGRFQYYTEYINLFDAIALAGGLTDFSDRANIKILREEGDNTRVIHVDLSTLESFNGEGFKLQTNDVVVVSPQKRKRWVANNNFGVVLSSVTVVVTVLSLLISINNAN